MLPLAFGWRDLLFANYRVDRAALSDHVPDPFEVQVRDGDAWLTVVPFVNVDVRPLGAPRWLGFDLPEVNLRTYVTHHGEPGVYFFSLDAQGALGVLGGRLAHFLPYYYARVSMRRTRAGSGEAESGDGGEGVSEDEGEGGDGGEHESEDGDCDEHEGEGGRFEATCRRRHPGSPAAHLDATYRPTGEQFVAEDGSLAAFLTARRRLYDVGPLGGVRYTDVEHEPYPLFEAEATVEESLSVAAGLERPEREPLCYYSPGVEVTATRNRRWSEG